MELRYACALFSYKLVMIEIFSPYPYNSRPIDKLLPILKTLVYMELW